MSKQKERFPSIWSDSLQPCKAASRPYLRYVGQHSSACAVNPDINPRHYRQQQRETVGLVVHVVGILGLNMLDEYYTEQLLYERDTRPVTAISVDGDTTCAIRIDPVGKVAMEISIIDHTYLRRRLFLVLRSWHRHLPCYCVMDAGRLGRGDLGQRMLDLNNASVLYLVRFLESFWKRATLPSMIPLGWDECW